MAYRDDPDLAFLGTLSSTELDELVNILTLDKDGEHLLTENLTYSENYKLYHPHHHLYWQDIAEELQLFGGNTFMNLLKGNKGVLYKEILCDVCDKLKVNYNKKSATSQIEQNLLMKILQDSLEKMSAEEIAELANELGLKNNQLFTPQAMTATFLAVFKAGGLKSYQLTLIIVNAVMKALFGRTLAFGGNLVAGRIAGILSGPIGWIITGIWTAMDIAGPAYRVTIPAVIQVAYLRSLSLNRPEIEVNQQSDNDDSDTENKTVTAEEAIIEKTRDELYDPSRTNFNHIKTLTQRAKDWSDENKRKLINAVYHSRTGMSGWDYIGPESTEVIWELAKEEKLRQVYQQAAALLPDCEEAKKVYHVLALAEKRRQSWITPTYHRNQTPSVIFNDFGFKLTVVNELMFNQEKLAPKFELQAFLDEDSEKCINASSNDVIKSFLANMPFNLFLNFDTLGNMSNLGKTNQIYEYTFDDVIHYFKNLDIPASLLSHIETLEIQREMPLYRNMLVTSSNGDIIISEQAINDLDLMPNLRSISISEEVKLDSQFQQAIEARGIQLIYQ